MQNMLNTKSDETDKLTLRLKHNFSPHLRLAVHISRGIQHKVFTRLHSCTVFLVVSQMLLKNTLVRKAFATIGADVRPVFVWCVHRQNMDPQLPTMGESFGTLATLERPVVHMYSHVTDQARALGESFSAHLALERFLAGVHAPVHRVSPPECELLATVRTEIAFVVSMNAPVSREIAPIAVALPAIGALVRFLASVFAHVVTQFFGKSKCHVTERA